MLKEMACLNVWGFVSVLLLLIPWQPSNGQTEGLKCCPPEEWEGEIHADRAVYIGDFGFLMYTNASIHIGYSVPLQKIYLGVQMVMNTTTLPASAYNATVLYDFFQGMFYAVDSLDNNCSKDHIPPFNRSKLCVPADAVLLSKSWLGDDRQTSISTYNFTYLLTDDHLDVRATVHETDSRVCEPVHITVSPDGKSENMGMISFDIFDIRPINSTDIFKIPKQCL